MANLLVPGLADVGPLPAGQDDVAGASGTTLTVTGTSASDQFSFDASLSSVVVSLNGETHSFAPGEFTIYVFQGGGGGSAILTGSASGNSASLYANGGGQLTNSTAGYAVTVTGMTSIHVNGHAGDTAQFFDSPGNDTFYAYADYNNSGQPMAGMYGRRRYSNSASGFGTNVGYSTDGGSDTAYFYDSPGNDTFYCVRRLQQQRQAVGRHVRQLRRRLFQLGQRLRHQRRLFDQRRQRYGRLLRLAGL